MKTYLFVFKNGTMICSDTIIAGDRGASEEGVLDIIRIETDYVQKQITCERLIDNNWYVIEK